MRLLILLLKIKKVKVGEIVDVYLDSKEAIGLHGFQFTLNFEKKALEFIDLQSPIMDDFSTANFASFDEKGAVTVVYDGDLFLEKK